MTIAECGLSIIADYYDHEDSEILPHWSITRARIILTTELGMIMMITPDLVGR